MKLRDDLFSGLPNLRRLNLSFNYQKKLPKSLFDLKHLEFIDLRSNELDREATAARLPGVEIRWS